MKGPGDRSPGPGRGWDGSRGPAAIFQMAMVRVKPKRMPPRRFASGVNLPVSTSTDWGADELELC
jgi:hypothetical protein